MTTDERLDRLERRLQVLEGLVRQLVRPPGGPALPDQAGLALGPDPGFSTPGPGAAPVPPAAVSDIPPAQDQASSRPKPRPAIRDPQPSTPRTVDSEQWFGQRGLLAIGVVFVILAAGYLLKLSFDRGWISPAARCAGGVLAGFLVGALGWRLQRRLATYGAALIGAGAAILYLSVWAATRLYGFLPPTSGIAALALVSLSLAAIAFAIDIEALGATAALGAFFAPLVVGFEAPNSNTLLLYLGFMGLALGWVAAHRHWRLATLVVGLSFFGLVITGASEHADPWWVLVYAVLGGSGGLYLGLREGWWETRILAFAGGWGLLGVSASALDQPWATLAGGILLSTPIWWRALRSPTVWPATADAAEGSARFGETLYFYLTPLLLAPVVHELAPATADQHPGLVPLVLAVPYLVVGYSAVRRAFAVVGSVALGLAPLMEWPGLQAVWALLALVLLWEVADLVFHRNDGRWYGVLALAAALWRLLSVHVTQRDPQGPAFVDPWALALWTSIAVLGLLARRGWRHVTGTEDQQRHLAGLCWGGAGVLLLFGVTGELQRYFRGSALTGAELAGGLAVSAWWILFAAGLVLLGFRRAWKPVRVAGLVVAGMAVTKVVLFDLSTLDALYRVGSVLILGVVSLGLAYLYHRKGRVEEAR